ncbi:hypothetical protein C0J52_16809 [Blattella germanica]|nr:hypothetical protein C0J52_16809 [Blattella germanica]
MAYSLYRSWSPYDDDDDDDGFLFSGDDMVDVEELTAYMANYGQVAAKIPKTLRPSITKIIKVYNRYLEDSYNVKKAAYKRRLNGVFQEMELFHVTGQSNVPSILRNNFDKSLTVRSKFGNGVSFSPDVEYANRFCNKRVGHKRAVIITKVLVGLSHQGCQNLSQPKSGYDTTTGNNGKVYVKYNDNEFCPKYVVFYNDY